MPKWPSKARPQEGSAAERASSSANPYHLGRARFRDKVRVHVAGGQGGKGATSFENTTKGKGAPDGGNGGPGGSVWVRANASVDSLSFSRFHFRGAPGGRGSGLKSAGPRGADVVVDVPVGTVVRQIVSTDPDTRERETRQLFDLDEEGARALVAAGGAGGLGNRHFKSEGFAKPHFSTDGQEGEAADLELELKLIADVGLVGYPNAGKSSLLGAVSRAKPRVAAYPFTTLRPTVGVAEVRDAAMTRLTVADIPGLVEGAHRNVGLGHQFLRHVERTRALVFVLDAPGTERRDPVADYLNLRRELGLYSRDLLRRPSVVFANKADAGRDACEANAERVRAVAPEGVRVIAGSALEGGAGVEELVAAAARLLQGTK